MIKAICSLIFTLSGWKYKSDLPKDLRSFVFIGAPHTSNYDFLPAMTLSYRMKRNTRFIIKKEWLKFPLGVFLKSAGALGIDRSALKSGTGKNTDIMAQLFNDFPELVLMISPEGTRSPNPNWKTGFYYIAEKANVPIVLGYADFATKTAGTGPIIFPSDFARDMQTITEFYQHIQGKVAKNFVPDQRFS